MFKCFVKKIVRITLKRDMKLYWRYTYMKTNTVVSAYLPPYLMPNQISAYNIYYIYY